MKNLKNLSLITGGALGAAALTLGAAGVAGAQEDGPTLEDPAPVEDVVDSDDARPERGERGERRRANRQAAIEQLVEDGVLTESQVDSAEDVRAALQEQRQAKKAERLAELAEVIGVTVEDLEAAKEAGTPLAEVAGDQLPAVVELMVDKATERIEQGVADGRLTQEQADEKLAGLEERIESRLENGGGFGGKGHGPKGRLDRPGR